MEKTTITKDAVIIFDHKLASTTFNRGCFGSFESSKLVLSLEEALYLKENKGLEIYDKNGRKLTARTLLSAAEKRQKRFWIRYKVFSDLRSKGYIVKTAFKYGGDFRVYDKGARPGDEHAAWILYVAAEHASMSFSSFAAVNRVAHSVKKKVLFGVVDDEGSVTYYEMNWIKI